MPRTSVPPTRPLSRLRPNGVVTGYVDASPKRWAAEDAAHRVRGVKAVASEIDVRLPNSSERTDTDIADLAQALAPQLLTGEERESAASIPTEGACIKTLRADI